jgi:peptidoglycan/LPS O-acetylase OafA/YrhL
MARIFIEPRSYAKPYPESQFAAPTLEFATRSANVCAFAPTLLSPQTIPGWHLPFILWCIGALLASLLIRFHASERLELGRYVPFFLGGLIAFALSKYRALELPSWGWLIAIAVAYAIRQAGFKAGWIACLFLGLAAPQFREISQKNVKKMAAWVARYSYGIYLSHMIIFWYVLVVLAHSHLAIRIGVCIALSIVCPVVLYHLLEKPMINNGVKLANFLVPDRRRRPTTAPASEVGRRVTGMAS